jgi:aspartyl-tRNA(Asn)/glutamyl-tRNA(Gln) amidotransferase subunit B
MASDWEAVVGLEVHAHLKTRTKMFCRCELAYGAAENTRTCPVCLAHPGSLPVPNGRAIEMTILLGLALDCEIVHAGGATGRSVGADYSLVDFNRGGTPLLEIVSAPDLRSAEEATWFLRLLRQTIVELGISDAEMEKGTLRADVNVSVRRRGEEGFRPRWEIKNMNSFTFVGRAIDAAFRQQVAAHEAGEEVVQSTYDYDADTDRLTVHRSKEEADDYRYFPEPDLVPVEPPAELVERLRGEVPERPAERIARLAGELGFEAAAELVTTGNEWKAEALAAEGVEWRAAAAIAMNRGDFLRENAAALAKIVQENVTREALDEAFAAAAAGPIDAGDYLSRTAVSDEAELAPVIEAVIAANPEQVETYRGGKEGVLGFLVGQVMRETQGKADPKVVNRLLRERLRPE